MRWAPASTARRRRISSIAAAKAFAFPGLQVDGMDVLAVPRCGRGRRSPGRRAGKGPILLETQDLPLSRPLDERSGEISQLARRCNQSAKSPIRSSMSRSCELEGMGVKPTTRLEGDRQAEIKATRRRGRRLRRAGARAGTRGTGHRRAGGVLLRCRSSIKMPALSPDHGRGHARQVAGEGRRRR